MTYIAPVVPASKVWGIPRTWALAAAALAAALAFPLAYGSNAYILNIATMVLIYAVTGSSWNLLGGYAGQPSFGHAAFFGVGAYTFAVLFPHGGAWTIPGFLIAGLAGAIIALPIGLLIFRLRGPYFALSMLAFSEILRLVAQNWTSVTMGASGFLLEPTINSKVAHYYFALVALIAILAITIAIVVSRSGYYFLAIREDQDVAEALGVNTLVYKMIALLVGAFFTGLVGAIYANYYAYIEPNVVFSIVEVSLATYLIAVLGGMGGLLLALWGAQALPTLLATRLQTIALPDTVAGWIDARSR